MTRGSFTEGERQRIIAERSAACAALKRVPEAWVQLQAAHGLRESIAGKRRQKKRGRKRASSRGRTVTPTRDRL